MHLGRLLQMLHLRKVDFIKDREAPGQAVDTPEQANVMCSADPAAKGLNPHFPVLDFDFPVGLFESTNQGAHLVLLKGLSVEDYDKLLKVLVEVGLYQEGNYNLWKKRGYTCVRLPWVVKSTAEKGSGDDDDE